MCTIIISANDQICETNIMFVCFILSADCTQRGFLLIIAVVILICIVTAVLVLTLFSIFVWSPLSQLSTQAVQHFEGNIPILAQVDAFVTQRINVQQNLDVDDSSHRVSIYFLESKCHDLPTTLVSQSYHEPQMSIPPVYMLEHSQIKVRICANTSLSESDHVIFYILKTVGNYISFDPHHPQRNDYL